MTDGVIHTTILSTSNNPVKTSQDGIELIKKFEGLRLHAYQDVADIWTIGYGQTGPDIVKNKVITEAEAEALLVADLTKRERKLSRLISVPLTQNQFDALMSLAYNIGIDGFRRSTVRKRLNNGDYKGAADAIPWWNKATIEGELQVVAGLVRRRDAERTLFLDGPRSMPLVEEPTGDQFKQLAKVIAPCMVENLAGGNPFLLAGLIAHRLIEKNLRKQKGKINE
jgi:lysozyme